MLNVHSAAVPSIRGVVVSLTGEGNTGTAAHLETTLAAIAELGPANAVLDLSGLTMVNSQCVGILVAFRTKLLRATDGKARVMAAAASDGIEKTMKFTRLNELFPLHVTVAEAVRAIEAGMQAPVGRH